MNKEEVKDAFLEILKGYIKDKNLLTGDLDNKDIIVDLKMNSARFVDLIIDIEDHFEIFIEDAISDQIVTVGDTVNLIYEIVNA